VSIAFDVDFKFSSGKMRFFTKKAAPLIYNALKMCYNKKHLGSFAESGGKQLKNH
jgi:hypothetical protein